MDSPPPVTGVAVSTERALRESRERFRLVVEHAGDAILLHDLDGRIVDANPQACRSLRYTRSELCSLRVADVETRVLPPERGVWAQLVPGEPVTVSGVQRRKDGTTFPVEVRLARVDGEDGSLVLALIRDLSDRKRAEELERRLLHADKLASIGQLAAGVAHEINNPAAFVQANLQVLDDQLIRLEQAVQSPFSGEDLAHLLSFARQLVTDNLEGIRRIASITRSLRAFSRIERDEIEWVDLRDVVASTANLALNEIRHRARLVRDLERTPPIAADRGKLSQVLLNLLVNAAHAIDEGAACDNEVRVRTRVRDGAVVLSVEDTGGGIPDEDLPRLFEPFFTTKSRHAGTGLGLALCADIVRQHGGEILVETELGRGSRFEVVLPQETGLRVSEWPPGRRSARPRAKRMRLLLVDDDELVRRALERILLPYHDVTSVGGGAEALECLGRDTGFDLVLCDVMMPVVDGASVYAAVQQRRPDLAERFVFISGGAFTGRSKDLIASSGAVVLEKPLDRVQLLALIDRLARRSCASLPPGGEPG